MKELRGYVAMIKLRLMESRRTSLFKDHSKQSDRRSEAREKAKAIDYWWNALKSSIESWNYEKTIEAVNEIKLLKGDVLLPEFPHINSRMDALLDGMIREVSNQGP